MSAAVFLCHTCRRQFPHKDTLDRHCCSSVRLEAQPTLHGKRKGSNNVLETGKKKKTASADAWTEEEEATLDAGVREFGTNWTLILYKYGSSFKLIHQQPCVLATKWSEILDRHGDVKPVVDNQHFPGTAVDGVVVSEPDMKIDVQETAIETVSYEDGEPGVPIASRPKLKLLVVSKPGGKKNSRNKPDEDDEDYVPELGADSDSDCSEAADAEEGGSEEDEEEEIVEEEEEEEEGEVVEEEQGAELTLSAVEGTDNTIFTTAVFPISAVCATSATSDTSSSASPSAIATSQDNHPQSSSSIFSPTYFYLAEPGSVAFPISSWQLANSYATSSSSSSSASSSELPSATYAAIPASHCPSPAVVSTIPLAESSDTSMTLPPEFQSLINSEEFQRLLHVPVVDLLAPGSRGQILLISVLSELARILATLYPGSRTHAQAIKFLDTVCMPWVRSFLPHFLSFAETNIMFDGEEESRPLLTGIQSKVKRLFLFYLDVLPQTVPMMASSSSSTTLVVAQHHDARC